MNPKQQPRVILGVNNYTQHGGVEMKTGANVFQSPQAPQPLPHSIPQVPGPMPVIGSRLTLSGGAYGR